MIPVLALALAASPSWQDLADAGQVQRGARVSAKELEAQVGRLAPERQKTVRDVLDAMAATPATVEGVEAAWKLVVVALAGLEKPDFAGSGEGPNRAAMRAGGLRVLHGLVVKVTAKKDLERMISTLDRLEKLAPADLDELKEEARRASKKVTYGDHAQ